MIFALGFAAVVVLLAIYDEPMESSAEPLVGSYLLPKQQAENVRPQPEPEPPKPESRPEPRPEPQREVLPVAEEDWPMPTQEEVAAASEPRYYDLPPGAIMGLTIEAIGVHNAPVFDADVRWALDNGVAHVPETSLPWSRAPQRNVYLAGHRLGWSGTASHLLFYNLDQLGREDEILLKDRDGRSYRYQVTEAFVTDPGDPWVMGQVRGRDMVTLQTCTPIPSFEKRLIVRADRV
jgi:sortase A